MADTILKLSRSLLKIDTNKDFFSDQIHYQITFTVLVISAIASTSLQYYADPIQCIQPAQFTEGYTAFARTLCWLNNTYFYPQTYTRLPMNKSERLHHTLRYYQWIPFIHLLQAFFFLAPHLVWVGFYKRNGLNPGMLVNRSKAFDSEPKASERVAKEIERYLMCRQLAQCKKKLLLRRNANEMVDTPSSSLLPNISIRVRYHTFYLVAIYLLIKLLYILNVALQVKILNTILSTGQYGFVSFGFDTMKYIFRLSLRERMSELSHKHQQLFPFVTLCDFHIRELGQDHYYTVECILLINIFYEKVFFAMWIWFAALFAMSIISFMHSYYTYVPFCSRYRFINKFIHCIGAEKPPTTSSVEATLQDSSVEATPQDATVITTTTMDNSKDFAIDDERQKEFARWLQCDGNFLLHLINSHSGEPATIKCVEELLKIWMRSYEDTAKLAGSLLKDEFHFS